jgi:hypothetical protein
MEPEGGTPRCANQLHVGMDGAAPEPAPLCACAAGLIHMHDCPVAMGLECVYFRPLEGEPEVTSVTEEEEVRGRLMSGYLSRSYFHRVRSLAPAARGGGEGAGGAHPGGSRAGPRPARHQDRGGEGAGGGRIPGQRGQLRRRRRRVARGAEEAEAPPPAAEAAGGAARRAARRGASGRRGRPAASGAGGRGGTRSPAPPRPAPPPAGRKGPGRLTRRPRRVNHRAESPCPSAPTSPP